MPKSKYCWDSTVFIALLSDDDQRTEEEKAGLRDMVRVIDRGEAIVITSSTVFGEVVGDHTNHPIVERLEALFQRPSFVLQDSNIAIQKSAGRLKVDLKRAGIKIALPDATFIAVALAHRAEALHTFDTDQLRLDGHPLIGSLRITKPHHTQMTLDLGA